MYSEEEENLFSFYTSWYFFLFSLNDSLSQPVFRTEQRGLTHIQYIIYFHSKSLQVSQFKKKILIFIISIMRWIWKEDYCLDIVFRILSSRVFIYFWLYLTYSMAIYRYQFLLALMASLGSYFSIFLGASTTSTSVTKSYFLHSKTRTFKFSFPDLSLSKRMHHSDTARLRSAGAVNLIPRKNTLQ